MNPNDPKDDQKIGMGGSMSQTPTSGAMSSDSSMPGASVGQPTSTPAMPADEPTAAASPASTDDEIPVGTDPSAGSPVGGAVGPAMDEPAQTTIEEPEPMVPPTGMPEKGDEEPPTGGPTGAAGAA